MSLQNALKENRERLGRIVTEMRTTGLTITEKQGKNEPVGELEQKFDKLHADMLSTKKTVERLEATIEGEKLYASLETGAGTVTNEVVVADPAEAVHAGVARQLAPGTTKEADRAKVKELHARAFGTYCRAADAVSARLELQQVATEMAKHGIGAKEAHALLGTTGALGGFLVPEDFRAELVKNLAGFTTIRNAGARVVPVSAPILVYPSLTAGTDPRSSGVTGTWRSEGEQGTDGTAPDRQNQPTFGQERIPVHVWQPPVIVLTRELLDDAVVPLDSIVAELLAETKAMDEDDMFINGSGVGRPKGIQQYITDLLITAVNSGSASDVAYNGLIDLVYDLPAQYRNNASFLMKSRTFGNILKLKDSSQMPLLYSQSQPDTLFGKKVHFSEFMPSIAGSAHPIVFGDFRFYCIAERQDMRIQRLEERFAPNVALMATARLGGGVLRTAAFRAQKIAA